MHELHVSDVSIVVDTNIILDKTDWLCSMEECLTAEYEQSVLAASNAAASNAAGALGHGGFVAPPASVRVLRVAKPCLVVPYVVLLELDALKTRTTSTTTLAVDGGGRQNKDDVDFRARRGIRWLSAALRRRGFVKGQSKSQARAVEACYGGDKVVGGWRAGADDSIVACAVSLRDAAAAAAASMASTEHHVSSASGYAFGETPQDKANAFGMVGGAVLLTDDKDCACKALVEGVSAFNALEFPQTLPQLVAAAKDGVLNYVPPTLLPTSLQSTSEEITAAAGRTKNDPSVASTAAAIAGRMPKQPDKRRVLPPRQQRGGSYAAETEALHNKQKSVNRVVNSTKSPSSSNNNSALVSSSPSVPPAVAVPATALVDENIEWYEDLILALEGPASHCIEALMVDEFGPQVWQAVVIDKPPWDARGVCEMLSKQSLLRDNPMLRSSRDCVSNVLLAIKAGDERQPKTVRSVLALLADASRIFDALRRATKNASLDDSKAAELVKIKIDSLRDKMLGGIKRPTNAEVTTNIAIDMDSVAMDMDME